MVLPATQEAKKVAQPDFGNSNHSALTCHRPPCFRKAPTRSGFWVRSETEWETLPCRERGVLLQGGLLTIIYMMVSANVHLLRAVVTVTTERLCALRHMLTDMPNKVGPVTGRGRVLLFIILTVIPLQFSDSLQFRTDPRAPKGAVLRPDSRSRRPVRSVLSELLRAPALARPSHDESLNVPVATKNLWMTRPACGHR